jgi:hypothetical protein
MTACGSEKTEQIMTSESGTIENKDTEKTTSSKFKVEDVTLGTEATESETETESNLGYQNVRQGDSITLDFVEIKIDKTSIDNEVYPKDTSGVYMYLPEVDGKKYFQLTGSLKNTYSTMYKVNNIIVQMVFDDNYTYSGYLKADSGVFDAYDYQVDPLESVEIHIIAEIPDELIESYSKCSVYFGFAQNFERVSSLDECDYRYEFDSER